MFKWLRKNNFIRDLREFLHNFKICEITREIHDEAYFNDQGELYHSGRQIITIRLAGYWKGKHAGNLEETQNTTLPDHTNSTLEVNQTGIPEQNKVNDSY